MLSGIVAGMSKIGHLIAQSRKSYLRKRKAGHKPKPSSGGATAISGQWNDREVMARASGHKQYFYPDSRLQNPIINGQQCAEKRTCK